MPGLTQHDTSHEAALYAEWKREGRHLKEYAAEFAGTAFLLFCVVGIVALMFASGSPSPRALPSVDWRLLCTGLLIGGASWLVAISPPGRLSGAHVNPAVSLGFWMLGKMHAVDLGGYVLAQMAGGVAGAFAGRAVFGAWARQVHVAALAPLAGLNVWAAFAAEAAATFALASILFYCVSHKRVAPWTPAVMMLTVGALVWLDGNVSGAGMNPARWLGPADASGVWTAGWIYGIAPCLGVLLAAAPRRMGMYRHAVPATGKLFHDPNFRSIFQQDHFPSALPKRVARALEALASNDRPSTH